MRTTTQQRGGYDTQKRSKREAHNEHAQEIGETS